MLTTLLAVGLAAAVQNAESKPQQKPAEEKKICIVEQSSSSRLGRKRICLTPREMKERQEQIERDSRL